MIHKTLPHARRTLILFFLMVSTLLADAGPFYVVVGSFTQQGGARRFAQSLRMRFPAAAFTFDANQKLYHVHLMETSRYQEAGDFRASVRDDNGFGDAWVYTDVEALGLSEHLRGRKDDQYAKLELYTGGSVLLGPANANYLSVSKSNAVASEDNAIGYRQSLAFIPETVAGISLKGTVSLLDSKGQVLYRFGTGEPVGFAWQEAGQRLTLICEVPGYAPETRVLDASDLSNLDEVQQNEEGTWEVRLRMSRFRVDEVTLTFRDLFYTDAAVLRSHSRDRLDALVAALNGNALTRVVINSHCNAGAKRRIKLPRTDDFDLAGAMERGGNDRTLTAARAAALRAYLVDHGIHPDRITEMGWAALDPMVKVGSRLGMNEREEVVVSNQ